RGTLHGLNVLDPGGRQDALCRCDVLSFPTLRLDSGRVDLRRELRAFGKAVEGGSLEDRDKLRDCHRVRRAAVPDAAITITIVEGSDGARSGHGGDLRAGCGRARSLAMRG